MKHEQENKAKWFCLSKQERKFSHGSLLQGSVEGGEQWGNVCCLPWPSESPIDAPSSLCVSWGLGSQTTRKSKSRHVGMVPSPRLSAKWWSHCLIWSSHIPYKVSWKPVKRIAQIQLASKWQGQGSLHVPDMFHQEVLLLPKPGEKTVLHTGQWPNARIQFRENSSGGDHFFHCSFQYFRALANDDVDFHIIHHFGFPALPSRPPRSHYFQLTWRVLEASPWGGGWVG